MNMFFLEHPILSTRTTISFDFHTTPIIPHLIPTQPLGCSWVPSWSGPAVLFSCLFLPPFTVMMSKALALLGAAVSFPRNRRRAASPNAQRAPRGPYQKHSDVLVEEHARLVAAEGKSQADKDFLLLHQGFPPTTLNGSRWKGNAQRTRATMQGKSPAFSQNDVDKVFLQAKERRDMLASKKVTCPFIRRLFAQLPNQPCPITYPHWKCSDQYIRDQAKLQHPPFKLHDTIAPKKVDNRTVEEQAKELHESIDPVLDWRRDRAILHAADGHPDLEQEKWASRRFILNFDEFKGDTDEDGVTHSTDGALTNGDGDILSFISIHDGKTNHPEPFTYVEGMPMLLALNNTKWDNTFLLNEFLKSSLALLPKCCDNPECKERGLAFCFTMDRAPMHLSDETKKLVKELGGTIVFILDTKEAQPADDTFHNVLKNAVKDASELFFAQRHKNNNFAPLTEDDRRQLHLYHTATQLYASTLHCSFLDCVSLSFGGRLSLLCSSFFRLTRFSGFFLCVQVCAGIGGVPRHR